MFALTSHATAQKLESGTASATTTPQYAKKVAQTYCDFLTAGIDPQTALGQAETEVANSATKPSPFNENIYRQTLNEAISEKGFCPAIPDIKKVTKEASKCNLSPSEIENLFQAKHILKQVGSCVISITAH